MTTELGGKTGSYAAAQTHDLVRKDLAASDRRMISAAFDRLARAYSVYNFGIEAAPPMFRFVEDEELYRERVERDVELYGMGWRPSKKYIAREYEMQEEDFEVVGDKEAKREGFSRTHSQSGCSCGKVTKENPFQKLKAALFTSKEEKRYAKDKKLMAEFEDMMLEAGQESIDNMIESYVDALGMVDNYKEARGALSVAYGKQSLEDIAHGIDEVRYASGGIGWRHD